MSVIEWSDLVPGILVKGKYTGGRYIVRSKTRSEVTVWREDSGFATFYTLLRRGECPFIRTPDYDGGMLPI